MSGATGLDWAALTSYAADGLPRQLARRNARLSWIDAQDAAAEALCRLWAWRARFDPARGNGEQVLAQIARRVVIDWARRSAARCEQPWSDTIGDLLADPAPGPEAAALATETAAVCHQLLANLPPKYARAVWWHDGLGIPMPEAAARLHEPTATFKAHVQRGRARARTWAGWASWGAA